MEQAWWISLISAALVLDQAMVGQFMICQPLVLGSILGALLGDLPTGLMTGAMVQLLWVSVLPVGAYIPSDHTVTGGITAALAIWLTRNSGLSMPAAVIVALMVAIPGGFFSGKLDVAVRHCNSYLASRAENTAERFGLFGIAGITWLALIPAYLRNVLVFLLWLGPGALLAKGIGSVLPVSIVHGLEIAFWGLPMLAFAVLLEIMNKGKTYWLAFGTSLVAGLVVWFLPSQTMIIFGSIIILGVFTAGWWRTW